MDHLDHDLVFDPAVFGAGVPDQNGRVKFASVYDDNAIVSGFPIGSDKAMRVSIDDIENPATHSIRTIAGARFRDSHGDGVSVGRVERFAARDENVLGAIDDDRFKRCHKSEAGLVSPKDADNLIFLFRFFC